MSKSTSSMSTPSEESTSSSEYEKKSDKKSQKSSKSNSTNKNDKGRHSEVPLQQTNTMTKAEKKRMREDQKLKEAESGKRSKQEKGQNNKTNSSPRATAFSEEETKTILLSLFKGRDDKEATDDFLKFFSTSTRTRGAIKAKVTKTREEFSNQINGLTDKDLEKNGMIVFLFFLSIFSPS